MKEQQNDERNQSDLLYRIQISRIIMFVFVGLN